jgi:EmrB/QacA subfamily drug resistance transporter
MTTTTDHRQHPTITFLVLLLGATAYALLQSLVLPALPDIQHALHTSVSGATWLLTAYLLSASVSTPIVGRMGDMVGKERMLMIVLVVFALGTVCSALAHALPLMLVGRVIQGAAGGIFPLSFGIIRDEFPPEKVPSTVGLMSSMLAVGGGAGLVLAGPITQHLDYHYLFWLPLIAIVIAIVATHFFVPESPVKTPGRINWIGALLMSVGLVLLLVGVSESPTWGWGSVKTIGCIVGGIVALVVWVANESRAKVPLVDMTMMRIRGVWTTNAAAFMLGFGMYSVFILVPQLVETKPTAGYGFGSSITGAGLFLLPSTAAMFLFGSQTGRLERRFGSRPPLLVGCFLGAASFTVLAFAHDRQWEIYVAAMLLGAGIGLAFAAMANLIIENVGPTQTGVATGINTVTRTVGGAFGGSVTATLLADTIGSGTAATSNGYTGAFGLCAIALVLAVGVGLLIPRTGPSRVRVPADVEPADVPV